MKKTPGGALFLCVLAGCAATAVTPPAPPPALAYRLPAPPTVGYQVGDTARVEIRAAGQSFGVDAAARERWRMEFTPAGDGARVTATLTDLEASVTNPLTAPQTADESTVKGSVVFTLDPRGRSTVESLPDVTPAVAQFLSGPAIAYGFFPHLPGRAVTRGESWVDTLAYSTDEAGAKVSVRTVTTYTVAGDSVVDGLRLLLVRTVGTSVQESEGSIGGTAFDQTVSGSTEGHFLFDLAAGTLHSAERSSLLTGSMAVAVAPVPLEVRVEGKVRIRRAAEP